jgi:CpeT/CpcT family (DUF1001)
MQCIYNKARMIAFLTSVCSLGILNITHAQTSTISNPALNKQAEEVASLLEGKMRTTIPAKGDYPATSVIMTTCRVRLQKPDSNKNPNSIFLYQEQAVQENLQKPYRQRLLELFPIASTQSIRSLAFKPSNPEAWVNFCDKPLESRIISLKDLNTEVCSLFLQRSGDVYTGVTPPNGCPTNVRGAVRTTNRVILQKSGMQTWDRGYDANGKQVWGAKEESYQFERISSPSI